MLIDAIAEFIGELIGALFGRRRRRR